MDEELVIDLITNTYNRSNNSELNKLKNTIAKLYNCDNVLITTSGLHAITTSILSINKSNENINIIYSNQLYYETNLFFKYYKDTNLNSNIIEYDLYNIELLLEYFTNKLINQNNILFFESCSNPNGNIFDFRIIPKLRELSSKLIVIVDNTWLSNCILNPFIYDVDIVVTSLTKYYSAGQSIAGVCIFKDNNLYESINNEYKIHGIHISPYNIKIINNNIQNQLERIINSSILTCKVIDDILSNNKSKIFKVSHPYINDHNSYKLGKEFFKKIYINNNLITLYPPSLIIILEKECITFDKLKNILINNIFIPYKTSFGTELSRIDLWESMTTNLFFRLSIGYNDTNNNIMNGINNIIDQLK